MGDLADLRDLAVWSARDLGASFVLVNPLHAGEPAPPIGPSPYLPMSRRFGSPLYLRVDEVPGYEAAGVPRFDDSGLIDRDAVWAAKAPVLAAIHGVRPAVNPAYERFKEREGAALTAFATWCALAEVHGSDSRRWPAGLRDPGSREVAAERVRLAGRVDFHGWLQWLLDEQLARAQRAARAAGMSIGVIHDLAVGVAAGGADTWAYQPVFARGMSVGAPPDEFNQRGQDWAQPPWQPRALAAAEYGPYREMLRYVLRHAGGLRLDHAMQVFRLWWVPAGASPAEGTYVHYDSAALLDVLVAEAAAAGAVVVGEDLGTVEDYMREVFSERGLLGTSLAWFERAADGSPLPPSEWRSLCLAAVGTHDMPPISGYVNGDHVTLRARLGLLTRPEAVERRELARSLEEWRSMLRSLDLLPGTGPASELEMTVAMHAFLARTPARLIGISLADAVGERRTQNQPGTVDEYPNWRVPLASGSGRPVFLDDLPADDRVRAAVAPVRART